MVALLCLEMWLRKPETSQDDIKLPVTFSDKGKKSKWHQCGPFNNSLQKHMNPSDVKQFFFSSSTSVAKSYVYVRVCVFMFSNGRGGKRKVSVARKRVFSPLCFSDYCCFGSWRPVMETWLSGKFVAVCRRAALHSNQQLSTQPRPLLMTATNCLTNSRHYLRASVK